MTKNKHIRTVLVRILASHNRTGWKGQERKVAPALAERWVEAGLAEYINTKGKSNESDRSDKSG